jgi:phospholipase/carboxylesterase
MRRAGPPGGRAQAGLVMLHGRGGNAADILGVLERLALPEVAGIAPEARGQSWWPTSFLAPSAQMEPYVREGLSAVRAAVAALQAEGLSRGAIWLCGFSQGACLALEAFAREGAGLAGVFGLSGGLVGTADAPGPAHAGSGAWGEKEFSYPGRREGARVWLSVHERDPHIPLARVIRSAEVLAAMGARVERMTHPGAGHAILSPDVTALRGWLGGASTTSPDV